MLWLIGLSQAWSQETASSVIDSLEPALAQKAYIDHNQVLEALKRDNAKDALKRSEELRDAISCPQRIPLTEELAMIWVHRGYAHHLLEKDDQVQLAWEQAFSISPYVQFDSTLLEGLSEPEQEDLLNRFEQMRRLVEAQGVVDPGIPEQLGEAKVFLNGRSLSLGQGLKPGEHLAQIVCPEDGLQSRWTTFEEPLDWFAMCPSGVDTTAESGEEDMFDGLFGPSLENTAQYYNPEPICQSEGFSFPSFSLTSLQLPDVEPKVLVTMGGGMSLVLGGVVSYYVWVTPAHNKVLEARDLAEAQSIDQAQARKISQQFNTARYATLGMLATGTALTGYGTILTIQQVSMTPIWTPGWIGVNGQF